MSGVLEAIRTAWQAQPELVNLVPASRVQVGPVNPGAGLPRVGLVKQQHGGLMHTSSSDYVLIQVTAEAEAESPESLETLADVIRQRLHDWQSTRFKSMRLADVTITITRDEESPSQLWLGEFVLTYEVYRR